MKPTIIFSGVNDRAIIAFCRYAEREKINYVIVANGKDDLIFLTDYEKYVVATRERNVLTIKNIFELVGIVKLKFSCNEVFILPSTEYLNRFLLNNKVELDKLKVFFGLCEKELYDKISNKYEFGILCNKYGVNIPIEYTGKPDVFPYVVKPKRYFDDNKKVNPKPIILYNTEQEASFYSTHDSNKFYFQEYVSGKSIYLLFYFYKNGYFTVYSQENFVQQSSGGSMIFCQSSNYHLNTKLVNSYSELFINEGFCGLVMVEVKSYKNQFYMIEANPRLWGPSQLILDANMSLFDDFSTENNLIKPNQVSERKYVLNKNYFWSGGYMDNKSKNKEVMIHNYNSVTFLKNYKQLLKDEIYFRKDTLLIYLNENK